MKRLFFSSYSPTGNWVERGGFRFEDFVLTRRKEENDGND